MKTSKLLILFVITINLALEQTVQAQEMHLEKLKECTICYDAKKFTDFKKLLCDHEFCNECVADMIQTTIKDQDSCHLRCSEKTCRKAIDPLLITSIASDNEEAQRLQKIIYRNFMQAQPHLQNCPTFDCAHFFLKVPRYTKMVCPECEEEYCRNCTLPHEKNVTCHKAKTAHRIQLEDAMTLAQKEAEKKSQKWVESKTKKCPNCNTAFMHDGGCTRMTCRSCGHKFPLNPAS